MSETTPKIKECTVGSFWQSPGFKNDEVNLNLQLTLKFEQSTTKPCDVKLPSAWYNEWDAITPTPVPIKGLSDIQMDNIYKKNTTNNLQKALDSLNKETFSTKDKLQQALDNLNYIKNNLL